MLFCKRLSTTEEHERRKECCFSLVKKNITVLLGKENMLQIQSLLLLLPLPPFHANNSWLRLCIFNNLNPAGCYSTLPILIWPITTAVPLTSRNRADKQGLTQQTPTGRNTSATVLLSLFSLKKLLSFYKKYPSAA